MAIAPITLGDTQSRAKLNEAIAKANLVDGKADATALASEIAARQSDTATLENDKAHRLVAADAKIAPGDARALWTGALDDTSANPPLIASSQFVSDSEGAVLRASTAQTVARIALRRLEPGREYHVRFAVRRRTNSPDPSNDGVRFGIRWFDQAKTPIGTTVLIDLNDITTGSGRQTLGRVIARQAGANVDHIAPAGARYARPFVQTFGLGAATDIEIIDIVDVTDAPLFAPDVSGFEGRLAGLETVNAGNRLDYLESAVGNPRSLTLPNLGTLAATDVDPDVQSITLISGAVDGDGLGGIYRRSLTPGPVQSHDGAYWVEKNPLLLLADEPTAIAGIDQRRGVSSFSALKSILANAKDAIWSQLGTGAVTQTIIEFIRGVEVTPEQFGAKNDGNTPDDAAFDRAYNYLMTRPNGGTLTLKSGAGYRLNAEHNIHPFKPLEIRWEQGAWLLSGLPGAGKVLLRATHPVTPSTRGQRLVMNSMRIRHHESVTFGMVGATFFEHRYASDLKFIGSGYLSHYFDNTAVRLSGLWNCDLGDMMVWGAGMTRIRKSSTGVTFSIAINTNVVTTNVAHFDASDVGKAFAINRPDAPQIFTVVSVTDSQTAVVNRNAERDATNLAGGWEGVRGSIAKGSSTLTLSDAVYTSDDIGRGIWVLDAVAQSNGGVAPLYAKIVSVAGTTVTLDRQATADAANVYILVAAVELLHEGADSSNITNDIVWSDLHIEQHRGAGLIVHNALNAFFPRCKLHSFNNDFTNRSSTINGVFSGVGGYISGDFEGTPINDLGRIYVCNTAANVSFKDVVGVGCEGQALIRSRNNRTGSTVVVGDWSLANSTPSATLANAFIHSGNGELTVAGVLSSAFSTSTAPYRLSREVRIGKGFPAISPHSGRLIVAAESEQPSLEVHASSGVASSVRLAAYGGTFASPATVSDFATAGFLDGLAYTATNGLKSVARITFRARSPSDTDSSGDILLATRSSGTLTPRLAVQTSAMVPGADNSYALGAGAARYSVVYAGTGSISTSDERAKRNIGAIPDEWLDAWEDVEWSRYRWTDGARWHTGLIAQRVRDAFEARGLDAFSIGLLCFDEWGDEPEVLDPETGAILQPFRPAGDRYGLRYDECFAMEAAWVRREMARLKRPGKDQQRQRA